MNFLYDDDGNNCGPLLIRGDAGDRDQVRPSLLIGLIALSAFGVSAVVLAADWQQFLGSIFFPPIIIMVSCFALIGVFFLYRAIAIGKNSILLTITKDLITRQIDPMPIPFWSIGMKEIEVSQIESFHFRKSALFVKQKRTREFFEIAAKINGENELQTILGYIPTEANSVDTLEAIERHLDFCLFQHKDLDG